MPEFEWGMINTFNAVVLVIIFIPNIIYSIRHKGEDIGDKYHNRVLFICEQIGRYASMFLMLFPIGCEDFEFGYKSADLFIVHVLLDIVLLIVYVVVWCLYEHKKTMDRSLVLAIVPTLIFLISGLLLQHWFLVFAAILFGIGHIYITYRSAKADGE